MGYMVLGVFLLIYRQVEGENRQDGNMQLAALNNPNYYLALNDETVEKLTQLCSRCAINVNGS